MKPDESRRESTPGPPGPPSAAAVQAAQRRDARSAVAAIAGLANRLADPQLPAADRAAAAAAVRKYCRRLLRLLGGQPVAARASTPPLAARRPHVLVAEDCPDSRQAVCSFLANAGLDVTPAENGRIAVALSRTGGFDLVLLDMQMPEIDGYEAARQLRGAGYRGPIIALTGDVQPGDEQACHDAGCDAYLAKPWDPEQLLQELQTHIQFTRRQPKEVSLQTTLRANPTLRQLAGEFARGLPRTVAEVSATLAAGNRLQMGRLVHQMSGAAGMFGYPDLCQAARQLEKAAKEEGEDAAKLDQRVRELEDLTRRIVRGLGDEA
jgi:CheY-like chemotaxis protein/HPt (histidine-containing phosphotransfer) domain-containing protein